MAEGTIHNLMYHLVTDDGELADYLKDPRLALYASHLNVYKQHLMLSRGVERLLSQISEDGDWTDAGYQTTAGTVHNFLYQLCFQGADPDPLLDFLRDWENQLQASSLNASDQAFVADRGVRKLLNSIAGEGDWGGYRIP